MHIDIILGISVIVNECLSQFNKRDTQFIPWSELQCQYACDYKRNKFADANEAKFCILSNEVNPLALTIFNVSEIWMHSSLSFCACTECGIFSWLIATIGDRILILYL